MAVVRFLVGRAGSGKTHAVVGAVRDALAKSPVEGERLLLLVPEQASLQTEAALLAPEGPGVAERAEVLSFRRLARRVLAAAGVAPGTILTSAARAMVLRSLVRENRERLVHYKRVDRFAGFLERLARTIEELIEEEIAPEALVPDQTSEADPARRAKLADVALLYRAYLDALGPDRADPSRFLATARRHFAACPFLSGARVFVDGFAGFTRGERLALADLAALSSETTIAILGDPDEREDDARNSLALGALFRKTARTRREIRDALAERGLAVSETIAIRPGPHSRFRASPALAALERRLFAFPMPKEDAVATTGVEIRELPTRRLEAEYAACRIHDLVRESGGRLRYRDVAVVARDLEPYHDLVSAALAARGIPYFIDRRRSIAHHPLVECVRSLARLAAERLSIDSVRLALKTDLLDLDRDEADELENAILAHAIEGPIAWTSAWRFAASGSPRVDSLRDRFLRGVRGFLETAGVLAPASGARELSAIAWAEALRAALHALEAEKKLAAFAAAADLEGRTDEADAHRRVAADVDEFLASLAASLGETPLDAEALSNVIDSGLAGLTLGLAPATADQVLVGAIERSRHPDLAVAFVIGLDERTFPRIGSEDAILSDDDREALRARGLSVASPNRERVPEEALLAYIAVTRPRERLVVTYAIADEKGKALRPSPFVDAIRTALPGVSFERVGDPFRERATWNVRSRGDLAASLAFEMRARPDLARDHSPARAEWNAIYEGSRAAAPSRPRLERALSALVFDNRVDPLGARALAALHADRDFVASVTRLESFARCPFQHFAKYSLRLREREEAALRPEDKGSLQHAILEAAIGAVAESRRAISDVAPAELGAIIDATAERVARELPPVGARREAERAHVVDRSRADLRRVLEAQAAVARAGVFKPWRTELGFGGGQDDEIAPFVLETPSGKTVSLRGTIDRIDVAEVGGRRVAVVIDYKLGRQRARKLPLDEVVHGISLQLPAYLLVVAESTGAVPGGAFYVSLAPEYTKVDHPRDFDPEAALAKGSHRPRGVVAEDVIESLERDLPAGAWAPHYAIYVKSDGTLGNVEKSDGAPRAALNAVLAATRAKMASLADGILGGEIAVAPYRHRDQSPCRFCDFRAACRFEFGQPGLRNLPALKRTDVLGIAPPRTPEKEES